MHGYRELKQLEPARIEGPFLSSSYEFRKGILTPGLQRLEIWTAIDVGVWGLGISTVEVHGYEPRMEVRLWIMATPVDGDHIDYSLAVDPKGRFQLAPGVARVHQAKGHSEGAAE